MKPNETARYLKGATGVTGGKAGARYFVEEDFLNVITEDIRAYARLRVQGYHSTTSFLAVWGRAYEDHQLNGRIRALEISRQYRTVYKETYDSMDVATMVAGTPGVLA